MAELPWDKNKIFSYMPLCKNIECTEESVAVGEGFCAGCMREKVTNAILDSLYKSNT